MRIEHLDESLARIHEKMNKHAVGIISAFRGDKPFSTNMSNHLELKAELLSLGYQVTTVKGSYIENYGSDEAREVSEKSLFTVNPKEGDDNGELESDLRKLAARYEQDAVLSKPFGEVAYIIGTSEYKHAYPSYGERVTLGNPKFGKAAEFFSRIKNRPFTFE